MPPVTNYSLAANCVLEMKGTWGGKLKAEYAQHPDRLVGLAVMASQPSQITESRLFHNKTDSLTNRTRNARM